MIRLHDVSKIYPDTTRALEPTSLEIGEGVLGVLGPNGAGKTTLLEILVLDGGRLLFDGPSAELVSRAHNRIFETTLEDRELPAYSRRFRVTARVRTVDGIRIRAIAPRDEAPSGNPVEPSLEEAYLSLLGDWRGTEHHAPIELGDWVLDLEGES